MKHPFRHIRRGAVMVLVLAILCPAVLFGEDEAPAGPPNETREAVERIVLWTPHDPWTPGPTRAEKIVTYSEREGVPIGVICDLLKTFVHEWYEGDANEDPPGPETWPRTRHRLCQNSLSLLAELRCPDALPLLRTIALGQPEDKRAEDFRTSAIVCVVRLGPEDLIDFARTISEDRERFSSSDRDTLYLALLPHVGFRVWWTPLEPLDDLRNTDGRPLRGDVFRLLVEAAYHEPSLNTVRHLDQTLAVASRFYRLHIGRETVLKRLLDQSWFRERLEREGPLEAGEKPVVAQYREAEELLASVAPENRPRLPWQIEDTAELKALAESVLRWPGRYLELDRLLVYEALAERGAECRDLLVRAVLEDPAPRNVIRAEVLLRSVDAR